MTSHHILLQCDVPGGNGQGASSRDERMYNAKEINMCTIDEHVTCEGYYLCAVEYYQYVPSGGVSLSGVRIHAWIHAKTTN